MKLFNIFCILCLTAFAFSSCGKYEVIEPDVENFSAARVVSDVVIPVEGTHDMGHTGQVDKGGSNNTAEICLVDFSLANPNTGGSDKNSKSTTTKP